MASWLTLRILLKHILGEILAAAAHEAADRCDVTDTERRSRERRAEHGRPHNVHLIYWSKLKRKRLSNPRVTEPWGVSGNPLIKAGENTALSVM